MSGKGYVGDIAENYDRELGNILFHHAEDAARRAAAINPSNVLEIAAGSGVATRELRNRLPIMARLTATDISDDMLNVARTKFSDSEQVAFENVDACALPYADASFDAIVCQFGYMFFPDKPKAVREAFRTLRPGGRYILNVWDSEKHNPFASVSLAVLRSFFPNNPPVWMKEPVSCGAIDPITEKLVDAGFDNIEISVMKFMRSVDALAFARGIVFGSPIYDEVMERGDIDANVVAQAFADELTRVVGSTLPIQAMVFEAERPKA